MLPATDASPAFGFGLCIAKSTPQVVRATAAAAAEQHSVVRLTLQPGDPPEKPRIGDTFRLPYSMEHFKPVFSVKARVLEHSGAMELQALKMGLLRIMRTQRYHAHRGAFLTDAQAIAGALEKGRSSAPTLRHGIAAVSAILLASDTKFSFAYLPSESNPADFPSRNLVYKRTKRKKLKHANYNLVEL